MTKDTNTLYTVEFRTLMNYITTVLSTEFPNKGITIEYVMLAILDSKHSHANLILDNCLMSDNIEELRKIYTDTLQKHTSKYIGGNTNMTFSDEVINLFNASSTEANMLNAPLIGTEHLLLAMLNPTNGFNEEKIFKKFHIDYAFIKSRYSDSIESSSVTPIRRRKLLPSKTPKKSKQENLPLKSQVNQKAIVTTPHTEFISKYTLNLNEVIRSGNMDKIIGRDKEINELIKVLCRRKKNNAMVIGSGGCGKTSVIYGLASMIESGNAPDILSDKEIVMLNPTSLISGTNFRGMYEERVNGLFKELRKLNKYILFIDDIHNVLKSNNKDKEADISGMIGEALNDGNIRMIGTTTFKGYHNTIESNSSISSRFQKIIIEPTNVDTTLKILEANKSLYEDFHHVKYSKKALAKAVELAECYITDKMLPDSAFDIIDLAGAEASLIDRDPRPIKNIKKRIIEISEEKIDALNQGNFEAIDALNAESDILEGDLTDYRHSNKKDGQKVIRIDEDDIANVVSEFTKIPVNKLSLDEKERIANIDGTLKGSVIGQDEAVESVCRVIKRNKVGLGDKTKTMANILMVGPTGCGKCVSKNTLVTIRDKKNNEVFQITISEFIKRFKPCAVVK